MLLDKKYRGQRIRRALRRSTEGKREPSGSQHNRPPKPRQQSQEGGFLPVKLRVPVRLPGPRPYNSPSSASSSSSYQSSEKFHASIHDITTEIERMGEYPHTSGGFGDIWKGVWKRPGQLGEVNVSDVSYCACSLSHPPSARSPSRCCAPARQT